MPLQMHHATPSSAFFDDAFRKHSLDRPGKLVFVGNHLLRYDTVRCLVRNISRQGADLEISPFLGVHEDCFLVIQGASEELSAKLIRREDERVYVAFNVLISNLFIRYIRKLGD